MREERKEQGRNEFVVEAIVFAVDFLSAFLLLGVLLFTLDRFFFALGISRLSLLYIVVFASLFIAYISLRIRKRKAREEGEPLYVDFSTLGLVFTFVVFGMPVFTFYRAATYIPEYKQKYIEETKYIEEVYGRKVNLIEYEVCKMFTGDLKTCLGLEGKKESKEGEKGQETIGNSGN